MAALDTSCLVGPVAFKDLNWKDDGEMVTAPPDESADIVSSLPSKTTGPNIELRQYQGVWMLGTVLPGLISLQRRFRSRPGDVLLASPVKSGTTWIKSLTFATMARSSYPPSAADHPLRRLNPHECVPYMEEVFLHGHEAKLEALPSPRLMHTHLHYSLLPRSLSNSKTVFVCREPKDMVVSLWHFLNRAGVNFSFSELFELICDGKNPNGPFWENVLGYWRASKARPDGVLFLRYEKMLVDPVCAVRDLARFLGVPFSAAEEAAELPMEICELCSIDTMRGLQGNKIGSTGEFNFAHQSYFRKGVVGDWVNHMTPEMACRMDAIVEEKLQGSGLTFTS
ncbi:cytosolic sulfotransferase 8-like [Lolium perenne]|uniref:cytosolic sulfotransferase 8-like n=1 Tax=Lolium perenne TaxID=4522 RepID=UPI0021F66305|nr:cytosolic sulfotransferase 8-like [Lolium perenne]XP_051183901.1 cytosolic sulfotransferase 8-like [Lolium perenne]